MRLINFGIMKGFDMTAKFKVGDLVMCVNDHEADGELVVGNVYYVAEQKEATAPYFDDCLRIKGLTGWWMMSRFELVQEEPATNFTVGQEVFLIANSSNHTKRLKSAVVLDAVPKHAMIRVSVGDIDCYVEEDRLFVKE